MSPTRRNTLLGTAALLLSLAPAAAHADALRVDVGSGFGVDYAMTGVTAGLDLRGKRGVGISAALGMGGGLSASAYLWGPGQHVRFGIGAAGWGSWGVLEGPEGVPQPAYPQVDYATPPHGGAKETGPGPKPDPRCGPVTCLYRDDLPPVAGSVQLALDHDFGDPEGFAIRYGIGLAAFATGGYPTVVPAPSIGLRYAF